MVKGPVRRVGPDTVWRKRLSRPWKPERTGTRYCGTSDGYSGEVTGPDVGIPRLNLKEAAISGRTPTMLTVS